MILLYKCVHIMLQGVDPGICEERVCIFGQMPGHLRWGTQCESISND